MKAQAATAIRIESRNNIGSVEHYYHFFYGYLVPLVNWYSNSNGGIYAKIYIRSCALLDKIVVELGYENIVILDKQKHSKISGVANYEGCQLRHLRLNGLDGPDAYSRTKIMSARKIIMSRLDIASLGIVCSKKTSRNTSRGSTIIIDRGSSNTFYQSQNCEIPNSGSMRRSIPNMLELVSALARYQPSLVYLENLSLRKQAAIFHSADIIIAQHGAAISNLIFCRPTAVVYEIIPYDIIKGGLFSNYFRRLARITNIKHRIILQQSSHGEVIVQDVLNAMVLGRSSYKAESLYYLFRARRIFSQCRSWLKRVITVFLNKTVLR